MQTDPIGYADQINLYAYVANDPMNHRDPSGMCFKIANGNCYVAVTKSGQISQRQLDQASKSIDGAIRSQKQGNNESDIRFTYGLQGGARAGITKLLGAKVDLDIGSKEISLVDGKEYVNQSFVGKMDVLGFSFGLDASRNKQIFNFVRGRDSVLSKLEGTKFQFRPVFETPWGVSSKDFWKIDFGLSAGLGIEGTMDFSDLE